MRRDPTERKMFLGNEVENTIAKGAKTLFVAGAYLPQEMVVQAMSHRVDQIYLAANQSYRCRSAKLWMHSIKGLLETWSPDGAAYVAIDVPANEFAEFDYYLSTQAIDHARMIVQLSVHVPRAQSLSCNTYLKIDDDIRDVSNPGVWTWPINKLVDVTNPNFTSWEAYKEDHV
jgi:hypothetical protein